MDLDPHHRANGPGRAARPLSREHRRRFAAANLQVVELTPRVAKETLRHAFRDAWRGHTWSQFLRTDSKAAEALQHCTWPQVRQRVHNMMMRWARGGEDRRRLRAITSGHYVSRARLLFTQGKPVTPCPCGSVTSDHPRQSGFAPSSLALPHLTSTAPRWLFRPL